MKIIAEVNCDDVRKIIEKQGHHAEHNFYHYMNIGAMHNECIFPVVDGQYGIMGFRNDGELWCYTDPLAPKEKMLEVFLKFLNWAFAEKASKVRSEVTEDFWKQIITNLKGYRAVKPSFIYFWPLYDLKKWDPTLSGIAMKKLRNAKNAFQKNHKIEILGKGEVSKKEIIDLIQSWKKMRQGHDRTHTEHYMAAIENGFAGYDSVRFIVVDGTLHAINGGWKIPNSNSFYSQLGIHDYSCSGLGEFMYIEDLNFLKKAGYDFADFGGSSEEMLNFKKKFHPSSIYKTVEFSIVKK